MTSLVEMRKARLVPALLVYQWPVRQQAGRPMADGERPGPGGWNRIHLIVDDIAKEVERLRAGGAKFRNDVVHGPGGSQVLVMDPSENLVELFERSRDSNRRVGRFRDHAGFS